MSVWARSRMSAPGSRRAAIRRAWFSRRASRLGVQALEDEVAVRVDADVGGDLHRPAADLLRVDAIDRQQRARGRQRVVAARTDADDAILRIQDVALAGDEQRA